MTLLVEKEPSSGEYFINNEDCLKKACNIFFFSKVNEVIIRLLLEDREVFVC